MGEEVIVLAEQTNPVAVFADKGQAVQDQVEIGGV